MRYYKMKNGRRVAAAPPIDWVNVFLTICLVPITVLFCLILLAAPFVFILYLFGVIHP